MNRTILRFKKCRDQEIDFLKRLKLTKLNKKLSRGISLWMFFDLGEITNLPHIDFLLICNSSDDLLK